MLLKIFNSDVIDRTAAPSVQWSPVHPTRSVPAGLGTPWDLLTRVIGVAAVLWVSMVFVTAEQLSGPAFAQSSGPPSPQSARRLSTSTLEEKILRYTNVERGRKGLPLLRMSPALKLVARRHSGNMCRTGTFRHESDAFPDGWERFQGRLRRVGLNSGGENIGYQTMIGDPEKWAKKMVKGWMTSSSHRKNILDSRFRYLGVGIRSCPNRIGYATQVFSPGQGRIP